jgi:topoisomerase-4 subunit B
MRTQFAVPGVAGGLRHLVLEVLAYAQDEAAATGRRGTVTVAHHSDGSITVDDDGRGTDTRTDDQGHIIRKPVMATADVRYAHPTTAPLLPDRLPRRGMSSVAALSFVLVHENHRADGAWSQTYRHGIPDDDLERIGPRGHSGTVVTFRADIGGPDRLTGADLTAFPSLQSRLA